MVDVLDVSRNDSDEKMATGKRSIVKKMDVCIGEFNEAVFTNNGVAAIPTYMDHRSLVMQYIASNNWSTDRKDSILRLALHIWGSLPDLDKLSIFPVVSTDVSWSNYSILWKWMGTQPGLWLEEVRNDELIKPLFYMHAHPHGLTWIIKINAPTQPIVCHKKQFMAYTKCKLSDPYIAHLAPNGSISSMHSVTKSIIQ
jgi:hypothetical protein